MGMNNTILNFLSREKIDINKINNLEENHIYSASDINYIIDRNKILKNNNLKKKISIADIKGYNYTFYCLSRNCIENISHFFNEQGSGYETRSIGMLDYTSENIVEKLTYSFDREPIYLIEADKNKYIIGDNGLHRFHILKIHFLKELSLLENYNTTEINNLKKKYTIDVKVSEVDFFKSYSKYILRKLASLQGKKLDLEAEIDGHWNYTGNVILKYFDYPYNEDILNDNQLKTLLNTTLTNFLNNKTITKNEFKQFFDLIENAYNNYDSFKEFFIENLQQLIPYIKNLNINEEKKI